jgi:hypothetical protein
MCCDTHEALNVKGVGTTTSGPNIIWICTATSGPSSLPMPHVLLCQWKHTMASLQPEVWEGDFSNSIKYQRIQRVPTHLFKGQSPVLSRELSKIEMCYTCIIEIATSHLSSYNKSYTYKYMIMERSTVLKKENIAVKIKNGFWDQDCRVISC